MFGMHAPPMMPFPMAPRLITVGPWTFTVTFMIAFLDFAAPESIFLQNHLLQI